MMIVKLMTDTIPDLDSSDESSDEEPESTVASRGRAAVSGIGRGRGVRGRGCRRGRAAVAGSRTGCKINSHLVAICD